MLEHAGRKVFLVAVLLGVALALLLVPEKPFNLGLDLRGGTRLVYSLDFEGARDAGAITEAEYQNKAQLLNDTITITRARVDPEGVLEPVIRPEGTNRIVIELPGTLDAGGESAESGLIAELDDGSDSPIELDPQRLAGFPDSGGVVRIDDEIIRYARRDGPQLRGLTRGHRGTGAAAHSMGATVVLESDDAIRQRIESLGDLSFQIVASAADYEEFGTDAASEREKLRAWTEQNPGASLVAFNRVKPEDGGPHTRIQWYPQTETEENQAFSALDRALAVLRPTTEDEIFRGGDLARVYPAQDSLGYPAVGFEMKTNRRSDFGDFTEDNVNRQMAIILNSEIASAPNLEDRLSGASIIRGRFTADDVRELMTILRSGSLSIRPQLEHEEVVGPTLGEDYVRRGFLSGIVALALVLGFMIIYYRRLGIFAAVALTSSFVMLMGGLAFLNATLTLPGIAGIILTVGMAVDANILIFDRIREEADKGRNVRQAAKTGFEKALSAILDANITTFLTAVVLYKIGTGPVRGFAVTLMIGIISSVFAALVITRLLVHYALVKGVTSFKVGTWMVKAKFQFLNKAKLCIPISLVAIGMGLALFVSLPEQEKLGIDFTGGAEVQLRTNEPQAVETMRTRVAQIEGPIGESATVKPLLSSAAGDGLFTEFRATFKTPEQESGAEGFSSQIRRSLGDLLLTDGVQIALRGDGATSQVDLKLFFEEPHSTADLTARLTNAGLSAVTVNASERANAYEAKGEITAGLTQADVVSQVKGVFRDATDSAGSAFRLATPIPSSSQVGPQVVGELRDKALLALGISLFLTVLYIRARFAEYSYGFAAVAAVFHDVLITLGILALVNKLGLLNGEITLAMIAAFLTIIGYSLNDTIVIFDRVRENLPRMKAPLEDVLNTSINQTLSRTILTSVTTFLAVACLFAFNFGTGNVLESFSFAMMIGVITGTYSTIFVANPVLLWLEKRAGRDKPAKASEKPQKESKKSGKQAGGVAAQT